MSALACFTGLTLLLAPAIPAQSAPPQNRGPYDNGGGVVGTPYWGYSGDPYMMGAAALMDASGKLMVSTQEALKLREEVRSAQLDTRRKRLEQWIWERENLPTPEDERRRLMQESLRRSRYNPPLTEVWSAHALNDLLKDLAMVEDLAAQGSTPLDPEVLEKLNLTNGKGGGNLGFLKSDLKYRPQMLRYEPLAKDTNRLVSLLSKAAEEAAAKQPDRDVLADLIRLHRQLRERLAQQVRSAANGEFTPSMYIDAKTYLDQIQDVIKVLQGPDAARHFSHRYYPKAKTVGELVTYMKANGLQFAPATNGSEDAYTAVHQALAGVSRRAGANVEKAK
jgi:hypothetical protein